MYFLIGGIQPWRIKIENQGRPCPACRHSAVYRTRIDHYVSLFFIPLFPVKRGTPLLMCHNCGTIFDESGESSPLKGDGITTCPACGGIMDPAFRFCPHCGRRL